MKPHQHHETTTSATNRKQQNHHYNRIVLKKRFLKKGLNKKSLMTSFREGLERTCFIIQIFFERTKARKQATEKGKV